MREAVGEPSPKLDIVLSLPESDFMESRISETQTN